MAKETRAINGSVRVGNKLYTNDGVFVAGNLLEDEDPLDGIAGLDSAQLKRLTEKGVITGFEKETKDKPEKEEKK
jgi:hypothetical protein